MQMSPAEMQARAVIAAAFIQNGTVSPTHNPNAPLDPTKDGNLIRLRQLVDRVMTALTSSEFE